MPSERCAPSELSLPLWQRGPAKQACHSPSAIAGPSHSRDMGVYAFQRALFVLNHFNVRGGDPALATVGQFDVGVGADVVQDLHGSAFVQDEEVLGALGRRGTLDGGDGPHHDGAVLGPGFPHLPLGEVPAVEGKDEADNAYEEAHATATGGAAQQVQ